MIRTVEINSDLFKTIGFSEATLLMNYPYLCDDGRFTVFVWGIDFNLRDVFFDYEKDGDIYVSGLTKLIFKKVTRIEYSVRPYTDESGVGFITSKDNTPVYFKKSWELAMTNNNQTNNYYISCVVDFPYGFCELKIQSLDVVTVEMKEADFIEMKEYLQKPQNFVYMK